MSTDGNITDLDEQVIYVELVISKLYKSSLIKISLVETRMLWVEIELDSSNENLGFN